MWFQFALIVFAGVLAVGLSMFLQAKARRDDAAVRASLERETAALRLENRALKEQLADPAPGAWEQPTFAPVPDEPPAAEPSEMLPPPDRSWVSTETVKPSRDPYMVGKRTSQCAHPAEWTAPVDLCTCPLCLKAQIGVYPSRPVVGGKVPAHRDEEPADADFAATIASLNALLRQHGEDIDRLAGIQSSPKPPLPPQRKPYVCEVCSTEYADPRFHRRGIRVCSVGCAIATGI